MNTDYTTADYQALTIPQLKSMATELKLSFLAKIKKADLIVLVEQEMQRLANLRKAERAHTEPVLTDNEKRELQAQVTAMRVAERVRREEMDTMTHDTNEHSPYVPNRRERREAKRQGQMRPDGAVKRATQFTQRRRGARGSWAQVL